MTSDDIRKALEVMDNPWLANEEWETTIVEAARFAADVLEGEKIDWCEEHHSLGLHELDWCWDAGWRSELGENPTPCRMVPRLLAPAPVEQVTCDVCDGRGRYIVQSSRGSLETDEIVCRHCGGEGQGGVR